MALASNKHSTPVSSSAKVLSMFDGVERQRSDEINVLVSQARDGDTHAFEQLYRIYVGRTYALCLRLVGDADFAEELTQSAFVRAWEKLDTFRGDSAFATWLHRLTVNVVFGVRRSDQRREKRVMVTDDEELLKGTTPARETGDAIDLARAIAQLPDRARKVFVLFQVEGYKHEEIAQMTGMSVGASKAQLHRARLLLREILTR